MSEKAIFTLRPSPHPVRQAVCRHIMQRWDWTQADINYGRKLEAVEQ